MNPENTNYKKHPEVHDPLEVQEPEQVTLRILMSEITNRTAEADKKGNGIWTTEVAIPNEREPVVLERTEKDALPEDPNRTGSITFTRRIGTKHAGTDVIKRYVLRDTAEGLQLTEYFNVKMPKESLPSGNSDLEEAMGNSARAMREIEARETASIDEDEMGLSYCSEQDARELLELFANYDGYQARLV